MRIKVTEIEANASELRECQTLSQNIIQLLTRAFQSPMVEEEEEEEEQNDE